MHLRVGVQKLLALVLVSALPLVTLILFESVSLNGDVISVLGIDFETTGRVTIWQFAFNDWVGRELFGYGFGGFWTDERIASFESINGWVLPNFHNGYVSLLIETGVVGVALFGAFVLSLLIRMLVGLPKLGRAKVWGYVALVMCFLVHNMYENNLTRSTDFYFLLFLLSVCVIGRELSARFHAAAPDESKIHRTQGLELRGSRLIPSSSRRW